MISMSQVYLGKSNFRKEKAKAKVVFQNQWLSDPEFLMYNIKTAISPR